jgi:tRNA-Thr(GGU) m(6)t(6)A37 methyltransferase TsaA
MPPTSLTVTPIGTIRTPFADRASAPRQPAASSGTPGTIELFPDGRYEHALEDIESFRLIWVLFWFHLNDGWKPKVLPPRSAERRGVFATRSPYRPNPIGMSVLRLERVRGLTLDVLDVDMIDGTPVLDIKPYLPYSDAVPGADHGWLDRDDGSSAAAVAPRPVDPRGAHHVRFSAAATAQLAFLRERFGIDLSRRIEDVLALGPSPHPYRRIKRDGDAFQLAVREWRVRFQVDGSSVEVQRVQSGYRPSVLFSSEDPALDPHRRYAEAFGIDGDRHRSA